MEDLQNHSYKGSVNFKFISLFCLSEHDMYSLCDEKYKNPSKGGCIWKFPLPIRCTCPKSSTGGVCSFNGVAQLGRGYISLLSSDVPIKKKIYIVQLHFQKSKCRFLSCHCHVYRVYRINWSFNFHLSLKSYHFCEYAITSCRIWYFVNNRFGENTIINVCRTSHLIFN